MKIAIASTGKEKNSKVSEIAGRAPYYLIYENKKIIKIIKNPFAVGGGGAGFGVAKMLADEGVKTIVGRNFGMNMVGALKEKKIKTIKIDDLTVKQALIEVRNET